MIFAAGTAVAVLVIDVVVPRWGAPAFTALGGAVATAVCAAIVPSGRFELLLWEYDNLARVVAVLIAVLTVLALVLYLPALRDGDAPAGETGFLLACAMTGGVVLGGVRDLITLIVALETLTLPLYALVALHRRRAGHGAPAAVTFFTTSVVATAVSLLGAALLNLYAGTVELPAVMRESSMIAGGRPLAVAGLVLLLTGLAFKVAAVPMHAWAPSTYDGAPVPIAAYLSTASKLGGVVAILLVAAAAVDGGLAATAGVTLAVLATLSLVIGTLVALRQQRTVRLLAWSSVAQAGFILAPLGGLAISTAPELLSAALAYTMFFLALEFGAFSGVAALRSTNDGGVLDDLRGLGRAAPWRSAMFALALIGLAGLPPALAGLFAKFTVLKALLDVDLWWLAGVVALMSVVGLAVYWRPLSALYRTAPTTPP
ncbi:NADH-quinone oxidoreductase subunit N, partial [Allorhizocola rhizosphaerae]|uniref:NADH-quinone oxidoreductase subunit N n=1 Tax=Allorhizocola rhizosphaerae TaxID=1872709 RepID=UPI001FE2D12C